MSQTPLLSIVAVGWCAVASAHHSFASYYGPSDPQGSVTLDGTVRQFRYTNPHGVLLLIVREPGGAEALWTIETLAPAMLSRNGWTKDSLRQGDRITVQGWSARDGSRLLRLQTVKREDGSLVGGAKR